ncbi:MAG: hypothetical protein PPP55_02750 [Halorubrum sp.]
MLGIAAGDLATGVWFGLLGVAVWAVPFAIAYLLYRRWRGDGPRSRRTDE